MSEALLISSVVLWIVVVMLALIVFALARQIGILHERVAPAGALQPTEGPKVGETTPALQLMTLAGDSIRIGGNEAAELASLIVFISPTCPVCKSLVPTACALANSERRRLRLIFASDGEQMDQHRAYVKDLGIDGYPYLVSRQLGMTYQVAKLPFAVLIGPDGTLASKGLVNTREHLESLLESMDAGIATVQEYMNRRERTYQATGARQTS